MLPYLSEISVFILGLCIGSFLNVCIYRLPNEKSIIKPRRSFCPSCAVSIKFYDNIPVVSYILLRGRCRSCREPIPIRYPLVELMTGLFALCCYLNFGPTPTALIYFIFVAALIVITYIDIDHQVIPDVISLPGIPIFLLASLALPDISFLESVVGLLCGGGSLFLVAWVYHLITKKEGMGGGDIKLLAMIGALVGWKGVAFTIFFSSAVGTVSGILIMLSQKEGMKLAIPFGPFLSIGAIAYLFFGKALVRWYLGLI